MMTLFKRGIALTCLVSLTACSSMQPVSQPREFMATRQPSVVWLTKSSDQTMVALDGAKLVGDSIVGFVEGDYVEIALAEVRSMQARQYSRQRTTAFIAGAGAVAVAAFFLLAGGHGSSPDMTDEDDIGIIRFRR